MIPEIWTMTDRIFSHPFPLPNNPVNQNFEKTPGGIIILHKCTINDNHMIYGFRDMNCTRPNVYVI